MYFYSKYVYLYIIINSRIIYMFSYYIFKAVNISYNIAKNLEIYIRICIELLDLYRTTE